MCSWVPVFLPEMEMIFQRMVNLLNLSPAFNFVYHRQVEARKIAVGGFLLILQNFKILGRYALESVSQSVARQLVESGNVTQIHKKRSVRLHSRVAVFVNWFDLEGFVYIEPMRKKDRS